MQCRVAEQYMFDFLTESFNSLFEMLIKAVAKRRSFVVWYFQFSI